MKITIVIPTLNEALNIKRTILDVRAKASKEEIEIVVCDCGSADGTAAIARSMGARVIEDATLTCRAEAVNRGAEIAIGDVFLFLDADTLLPERFDEHVALVFNNPRGKQIVGGAFEFSFDGNGLALRIIELVNRIRYRIAQQFYSDQGVFVRRDAFLQVGGFPVVRLMETSHFCSRLRGIGSLQLLVARSRTSPRRFLEGGIWRVFFRDVNIWLHDAIGFDTDRFAADYRCNNLRRGQRRPGR